MDDAPMLYIMRGDGEPCALPELTRALAALAPASEARDTALARWACARLAGPADQERRALDAADVDLADAARALILLASDAGVINR
jgi:hypothetical protein